jgi:hypothetical protein
MLGDAPGDVKGFVMTPFVLDITLRSPIILSYRTMLDSLLIGIGYERYGAASPVRDALPLQMTHGVPHASQMLVSMPDVPLVRSTTLIQSMIRVLSNNALVTDMLQKQPPPSSMSHGSGPNSNVESIYVTHAIPRVTFLGVGDIARVRHLTATLVHLGSQAHKGNGEVEQVSVTEVAADPTWFGIIGQYEGQSVLLRPVPKRLAHLLPRDVYGFDTEETWSYPYFPGHPEAVVEPCLVPPFVHGEGFHRDVIRRFYGR